jgi:hypothetical protein
VEMTTQGTSGPLAAASEIEAYRACMLSGRVHTATRESDNGPENNIEYLTSIHSGDWAAFKNIKFGTGVTKFRLSAASGAYGGTVEIRIDKSDGPLLGSCGIPPTGGWQQWQEVSCPIESATGIHPVYLVFKGRRGRIFDIKSLSFEL